MRRNYLAMAAVAAVQAFAVAGFGAALSLAPDVSHRRCHDNSLPKSKNPRAKRIRGKTNKLKASLKAKRRRARARA